MRKKRKDGRQREAIIFFSHLLMADCERIAIEHPVGIIGGNYIKKYFPDLVEKYNLPKKHRRSFSHICLDTDREKIPVYG